ncbi:aldose epimerase family protein [Flavobacterium fluviatile]|uniref:aldose epimerase family protein n=1 Tax=Flavobacterium fluviatile TaxID=1862387 RepID=UPI0013D08B6A|nr:aldose epimerase family protein [Flavobacterium fluviatile]
MEVTKSKFGTHHNKEVSQYTLSNDNGMVVKIMDFGATITSITVPNSDGSRDELVCGFEKFESYFSEEYKNNAPYFGSIVGRYSSQIKDSKFTLNGKEYLLTANCGNNNLHGGAVGFDKKMWESEIQMNGDKVGVKMSLLSTDLEEGFPGNVKVFCFYSLDNDNVLSVRYLASTDADTPLSLTNHAYFNLSGFTNSIENHTVTVAAAKKLEIDHTGAATGKVVDLEGQVDDLRFTQKIADLHAKMKDGFEHYFIFDKNNFELEQVAEFQCAEKNRSLTVFTAEPGMLFYTGKYTSDALQRETGEKYGKYRGFCCETHRYPNGMNISNSPKSITKKDEDFQSETIFKFSF